MGGTNPYTSRDRAADHFERGGSPSLVSGGLYIERRPRSHEKRELHHRGKSPNAMGRLVGYLQEGGKENFTFSITSILNGKNLSKRTGQREEAVSLENDARALS